MEWGIKQNKNEIDFRSKTLENDKVNNLKTLKIFSGGKSSRD